ncbi:type VI secretion system baseplate subunit TssF [Methylomicrobium album]|uniref:Type VI secretion protein, VC_A0110 family n=1 Tax=Methylomicrobium album BG8 TaxID=686340 RepID=H8GN67_METAL|nr:type VI secretion system baseplate subunit TssF [Methylomicrobium album]EIC30781.1 type VI secretion protein, VC_A0110 family [Methylomicrobium album BG8]
MDPRLLNYYNRELQHVREIGAEFAAEYPKIAARLGLDTFECADPYVERLFEGFAFMAARVQLKIDAEFPRFTQNLLEIVYPHYLASTPSMAVVEFAPKLSESGLAEGFVIPRDTVLRGQIGKGEQIACEYRTAHPLKLFPLEIRQVDYLPTLAAVSACGLTSGKHLTNVKAALRIVLNTTAGVPFDKIALDTLTLFLRGTAGIPYRLYEQLLANSKAVAGKFRVNEVARVNYAESAGLVRGMGFAEDEAMLRNTPRSFTGYRMLQEYFAFPERYLFVELSGLAPLCGTCPGHELELFVLFERSDANLIHALDKSNFGLFCVPAINLFPKRSDRIHVDPRQSEFHVVVDRTRPMDYEVHSIEQMTGYGSEQRSEQTFLPFYGSRSAYQGQGETAFYTLNRRKRVLSSRQRREGIRSSYIGSEMFVSLVDAAEAPFSPNISMLGLDILCTNRDLPLLMPVGVGDTDFTLQIGAPVQTIRCVAGPTRPLPAAYEGDTVWRLISHLSLNYLSLIDSDAGQGAVALRELLSLYADQRDSVKRKQIEGVVSVGARNVVRRIDTKGPIVFGRGLEVSLTLDESAFEGGGYFLMGKVLEQFFAQHVSINSFVETVVRSTDRGEVARWPARIGRRHIF